MSGDEKDAEIARLKDECASYFNGYHTFLDQLKRVRAAHRELIEAVLNLHAGSHLSDVMRLAARQKKELDQ